MSYKTEFLRAMDKEGLKYTDESDLRVRVAFHGKNTDDIVIKVVFDEDGDGLVALRCWSFGSVKEGQRGAMVAVCNELNRKYRWVKFAVDDDSDVAASIDAIVDMKSVGPVCINLLNRMADICDEAYPTIMRTMWG